MNKQIQIIFGAYSEQVNNSDACCKQMTTREIGKRTMQGSQTLIDR